MELLTIYDRLVIVKASEPTLIITPNIITQYLPNIFPLSGLILFSKIQWNIFCVIRHYYLHTNSVKYKDLSLHLIWHVTKRKQQCHAYT